MADSTINYGFPYPTGEDAVAVHSDIRKLAQSVDAKTLSNLGGRTVSIDGSGQPYLDPATGTHFILSDSSGIPYISRSITPAFTLA